MDWIPRILEPFETHILNATAVPDGLDPCDFMARYKAEVRHPLGERPEEMVNRFDGLESITSVASPVVAVGGIHVAHKPGPRLFLR